MAEEQARRAAIFNVYAYLWEFGQQHRGDTFANMVHRLQSGDMSRRQQQCVALLQRAMDEDRELADSVLMEQQCDKEGMCAFAMMDRAGQVTAVFRGTGWEEWVDNGQGLAGLPTQNVYYAYDSSGRTVGEPLVRTDFATGRQAQALNWWNQTAARNGWTEKTDITLSGHSKGGNKAQFVTLFSPLVTRCFSFDGQGFSPEALASFGLELGEKYDLWRRKINNLSAYNDYVNVLGKQAVPEEQVYYLQAPLGQKAAYMYHYMEAILQQDGTFQPPCPQGKISRSVGALSDGLMALPPGVRQHATVGLMELFAKLMGEKREREQRQKGLAVMGLLINLLGEENVEILRQLGEDNLK